MQCYIKLFETFYHQKGSKKMTFFTKFHMLKMSPEDVVKCIRHENEY